MSLELFGLNMSLVPKQAPVKTLAPQVKIYIPKDTCSAEEKLSPGFFPGRTSAPAITRMLCKTDKGLDVAFFQDTATKTASYASVCEPGEDEHGWYCAEVNYCNADWRAMSSYPSRCIEATIILYGPTG